MLLMIGGFRRQYGYVTGAHLVESWMNPPFSSPRSPNKLVCQTELLINQPLANVNVSHYHTYFG